MQLALYKKPNSRLGSRLLHWIVTKVTGSEYSHAELVIHGYAYSASMPDGGVRARVIWFDPNKWDIFEIDGDEQKALEWFHAHMGQGYDWLGAARLAIPFIPQRRGKWFCFEAIGAALGIPDSSHMTADDLLERAVRG